MRSKFKALLFALLVGLAASSAVFAQATGGLSGIVTDANGAVVPGVNVTIKNSATNLTRHAAANGEGRWSATLLPVGTYTVSFEKDGFKKSQTQNVAVEASVGRVVDVVLEVGRTDVFGDDTSD